MLWSVGNEEHLLHEFDRWVANPDGQLDNLAFLAGVPAGMADGQSDNIADDKALSVE